MNELTLHPNVYATGHSKGLVSILERVWLRDQTMGDGTMYVVSGFANYNGGVRFFPVFRHHIEQGGRVVALFSGSTRQNLTSKQVVREMLDCGAEVHLINRKRLMHAKTYGSKTRDGEMLVVTSGNFTGPGMAQNVEMAVLLDRPTTHGLGFSWETMISSMLAQRWDLHRPDLSNTTAPAWQLLYDEEASTIVLDETDEVTMILRLGHADTVRIMAAPGTVEGRGSQYFWLSRDCYDFFPALTILNTRGYKRTYSTNISMNFIDLRKEEEVRVTFEAENNLDFRLGTGPLRYTRIAQAGDIAAISRVGESRYELRIYKAGSSTHAALASNAINFIGHQGKQYGFMSNQDFQTAIGSRIGRRLHS
jgi:hypothetical protein